MARALSADVIVIGAGVAGLAAADVLRGAGMHVLVLEARGRHGGRILTHRPAGLSGPIELGAEFLHGDAAETRELIARGRLRSVDVSGRRWQRTAAGLRPLDDFWSRLRGVMRHLPDARHRDESFGDFLARHPGGRGAAADRRLARQFVEGFQAADPRLISSRALGSGSDPSEAPDEQVLGRVLDGYDRVPDVLATPLASAVRYRTVVETIRWRTGHVDVEARAVATGRTRTLAARAVVVAVPAAVLRADSGHGRLRFVPEVPGKARALAGLAIGAVVRLVVECHEPFWTSLTGAGAAAPSLDGLSFLHTGRGPFQTWWTAYPERVPLLVAWRGGPGATMLPHDRPGLHATVVASMADAFGITPRRATSLVARVHSHDWQADPYARGAYSYQVVGGERAPAALARPVRGTVFFAGEATADDGRIGTVDGAIASGYRAARQVRRALRSARHVRAKA